MSKKGVQKKKSLGSSRFAQFVLVTSMIAALVMTVDEMLALDGDFRLTLWDRIAGKSEVPQGRVEVSIQLAQEVCRQKVIRELGSSLIQASFDGRSSRYNPDYKVHTIFMNLQISGEKRDADIYARCDVSAVNRTIIEYRIQGWGNPFWG